MTMKVGTIIGHRLDRDIKMIIVAVSGDGFGEKLYTCKWYDKEKRVFMTDKFALFELDFVTKIINEI